MTREYFLKNYMEEMVWSFMDEVLDKYPDACKCQACRYDIAALALNELPPHYVAREKGDIYSRLHLLEAQHKADVYAALTRAVLKVKENPRHNED